MSAREPFWPPFSRSNFVQAALGGILEHLAECERQAFRGSNGSEYDELLVRLEFLDKQVESIGSKYLHDASIASRYHSVNPLDVQLDEATKMHFLSRAQGSFWTVYQKVKGQRAAVLEILKEL